MSLIKQFSEILYRRNVFNKFYSSMREAQKVDHNRMNSWQIHSYGDGLQLTTTRMPVIHCPHDVLVEVEASSVNPIDIAMSDGYGASLIGILRKTNCDYDLPITLGRDFAGTVIAKGHSVTDHEAQIGQKVWGVVPVQMHGSHSEYVVVPSNLVRERPSELTATEAASMLYAGVTAWSALWLFGNLIFLPAANRKVLVLGASGGVGSAAVQLLRASDSVVFATCSTNAVSLVESLGANYVLDYTQPEHESNLKQCGPFDIILDCAGLGPDVALQRDWQFRAFITLSSPLLKNTDKLGLAGGLLTSAAQFIIPNVQSIAKRSGSIRWAYFVPSEQAIDYISSLVRLGKMRPIIDSTYNFDDLPKAYDRVKQGHLRGKVAVDTTNSQPSINHTHGD